MPDLKYLYHVLYIAFKQIVDIFFPKFYYQESNIDFEKPSIGSISESPKICLTRF